MAAKIDQTPVCKKRIPQRSQSRGLQLPKEGNAGGNGEKGGQLTQAARDLAVLDLYVRNGSCAPYCPPKDKVILLSAINREQYTDRREKNGQRIECSRAGKTVNLLEPG